jgi:hypothetical protein
MMTNSASLLLVELERLDDRAPAGRQVVMRNELLREWRRLQRADARAPAKLLNYRQRQFVDRDASS